ncbi:MAG: hypothetical protein HZC28_04115 [Spirochaetes bacterium]|nr:hypothetical protein [Spirochaetota bacterium]
MMSVFRLLIIALLFIEPLLTAGTLVAYKDDIYFFIPAEGSIGLWKIKNRHGQPELIIPLPHIVNAVSTADRLYLVTMTADRSALWRSDGTSRGTEEIMSGYGYWPKSDHPRQGVLAIHHPGLSGFSPPQISVVPAQNVLYIIYSGQQRRSDDVFSVSAEKNDEDPYASPGIWIDRGVGSPILLKQFPECMLQIAGTGNEGLAFSVLSNGAAMQIWKSDGTRDGTRFSGVAGDAATAYVISNRTDPVLMRGIPAAEPLHYRYVDIFAWKGSRYCIREIIQQPAPKPNSGTYIQRTIFEIGMQTGEKCNVLGTITNETRIEVQDPRLNEIPLQKKP